MNVWQFLLENHTEVLELTGEHLWLVGVSTIFAVLIGIPLGILIARRPTLNKPILGERKYYSNHPQPGAFRIFAARALDWGTRRPPGHSRAHVLRAAATYPQHLHRHQGRRPFVVEAARGMGMTDAQVFGKWSCHSRWG